MTQLFEFQNLMPHGYCLSWGSTLLWLHVVSDALITLSYFSIPLMLVYFLRQRKDFPFPWLIALFASFIVACGTTHLLSAVTVWIPLYWLEGYLKALTALVSIATAIVLLKMIPQALKLTTPAQLEAEIERRKISDQEHQSLLTRLEKITNCLPGVVFQFQYFADRPSRFLYCSEGVEKVYKLTAEEVLKDATKFFNRLHPEDRDFVMNSIVESAQTLVVHRYPFRIQFEDGEVRWLMVNATPEHGDDSSTIWHGFIHDITEQKQAEETVEKTCAINRDLEKLVQERTLKLQEINDTLAERIEKEVKSNRDKDGMLVQQSRLAAMGEMMNNIAHQWRQPLNALNLVLANIEDAYNYDQLTAAYLQQQIAKGDQLVQTMSSTIDDFRDFFKSDGTQETFDIRTAIQDVLVIIEASFRNNDIEVEVNTPDSVNVYAFKGQYRQVLLNILGNAKDVLTERKISNGKVVISLEQEDDFAVVRIRDNAGGIKDDVIQKVFDPYFTTRPQGNGIGLYMSKMIIENNMHGELSVKNTDVGAEFVVKVRISGGFISLN